MEEQVPSSENNTRAIQPFRLTIMIMIMMAWLIVMTMMMTMTAYTMIMIPVNMARAEVLTIIHIPQIAWMMVEAMDIIRVAIMMIS